MEILISYKYEWINSTKIYGGRIMIFTKAKMTPYEEKMAEYRNSQIEEQGSQIEYLAIMTDVEFHSEETTTSGNVDEVTE